MKQHNRLRIFYLALFVLGVAFWLASYISTFAPLNVRPLLDIRGLEQTKGEPTPKYARLAGPMLHLYPLARPHHKGGQGTLIGYVYPVVSSAHPAFEEFKRGKLGTYALESFKVWLYCPKDDVKRPPVVTDGIAVYSADSDLYAELRGAGAQPNHVFYVDSVAREDEAPTSRGSWGEPAFYVGSLLVAVGLGMYLGIHLRRGPEPPSLD